MRPLFYKIDVSDKQALEIVFAENSIDAIIHFAGYKAVGESLTKPLDYYRNNLDTAITVLEVMKAYGCKKFIFSSSATVYSLSEEVPFKGKRQAIDVLTEKKPLIKREASA